jgi:hypothetical protein
VQKESLTDQTGMLEKLYSGTSKRNVPHKIQATPLCKGSKAHLYVQGMQR